jgi:hypothetical protein
VLLIQFSIFITKRDDDIMARADITNFNWHDLRHEALSRLAERGALPVLENAKKIHPFTS